MWGILGTEIHCEPAESSSWGGCFQLGVKVLDWASGELVVCVSGLRSEKVQLCCWVGRRVMTPIGSVRNL